MYNLKIIRNIKKDSFICKANKYLRKDENFLNEKLENFYKLLVNKYNNDANTMIDKKHFCVLNFILMSFEEPWDLNEKQLYSIFFIIYSYCVSDFDFTSGTVSNFINISNKEFEKEIIKITLCISKKLHLITTNPTMFNIWEKHWEHILKNNNLNKISLKEII